MPNKRGQDDCGFKITITKLDNIDSLDRFNPNCVLKEEIDEEQIKSIKEVQSSQANHPSHLMVFEEQAGKARNQEIKKLIFLLSVIFVLSILL